MKPSPVRILLLSCALLYGCAGPTSTPTSEYTSLTIATEHQKEYARAMDLLEGGEPAKAAATLTRLTDIYPQETDLWMNLAIAHYRSAEYVSARSATEQALTTKANIPQAYNLQGLIATEQGHYLAAEEALLKALKLDKNYAHAHYNVALVYDLYLQDLPKAIRHYEAYLAVTPDDSDTQSWVEQLKRALNQD